MIDLPPPLATKRTIPSQRHVQPIPSNDNDNDNHHETPHSSWPQLSPPQTQSSFHPRCRRPPALHRCRIVHRDDFGANGSRNHIARRLHSQTRRDSTTSKQSHRARVKQGTTHDGRRRSSRRILGSPRRTTTPLPIGIPSRKCHRRGGSSFLGIHSKRPRRLGRRFLPSSAAVRAEIVSHGHTRSLSRRKDRRQKIQGTQARSNPRRRCQILPPRERLDRRCRDDARNSAVQTTADRRAVPHAVLAHLPTFALLRQSTRIVANAQRRTDGTTVEILYVLLGSNGQGSFVVRKTTVGVAHVRR